MTILMCAISDVDISIAGTTLQNITDNIKCTEENINHLIFLATEGVPNRSISYITKLMLATPEEVEKARTYQLISMVICEASISKQAEDRLKYFSAQGESYKKMAAISQRVLLMPDLCMEIIERLKNRIITGRLDEKIVAINRLGVLAAWVIPNVSPKAIDTLEALLQEGTADVVYEELYNKFEELARDAHRIVQDAAKHKLKVLADCGKLQRKKTFSRGKG